ncbi:MAG: (Fe-S)-binding protein, partial [Deltaproteobacteria bacterium]|nr:(Fe-S)-binding protein [Deltaproteobacteria bacterium]
MSKGRFDLCTWCPELCMDRCVVAAVTGSNSATPRSKMALGWALERGLVKADADLARALHQCTGCLSCNEACKYRVDVEQALFDLRARLVREGVSPYARDVFETPTERLVAAQAAVVPEEMFVPEAQAVLFPGCHALLDDGGSAVTDVLGVFKALGIEFVGASRDAAICCGYPLWAGGYAGDFADRARRVTAVLRRYRMVVAASPCCAYAMRTLYAAAGVTNAPRVTLALELIAPLVVRTAREPLGLAAAWHDSCFLGRHLGQYEMPREVVRHVNGRPAIELRRHGPDAPCCGAGGALDRTHPLVA